MNSSTDTPRRPVRRQWLLRGASGVLAFGLALVAVLHTPPVRSRVQSWLIERLRTDAGLTVSSTRFTYNLLTLTADLDGVAASAEGSDIPFFHADVLHVDLPWSIVGGTIRVQSLQIDRPRLTVVRQADGTLNLPATTASPEPSAPLGPIHVDRLAIRDLALEYRDQPARIAVEGRGVTLDMTAPPGSLLDGRLTMTGGGTIQIGDHQTAISELSGHLAFDGTALSLTPLTLRLAEGEVQLDGQLSLFSDTPRADLRYAGQAVVERLAPWLAVEPPPRGALAFSGRIDGPLSTPSATFEVASDAVAWSGLDPVSLRAQGSVSATGAQLDTLRASVASGELTGEARVGFAPTSPGHASIRWNNVDAGRIVAALATDLGVRIASVASGTATLDWQGSDVLLGSGSLTNTLVANAASQTALPLSGRTELNTNGGEWRVSLDHRVADAASMTAALGGHLSITDLAASGVEGRATLTSQVDDALGRLARAGLDVGGEARELVTASVELSGRIGGTLGAPTLAGTLVANEVHYDTVGPATSSAEIAATRQEVRLDSLRADLGVNSLTGHVAVDLDAHSLRGDLAIDAPAIATLASMVPSDWRPSGAARIDAHLGGTLDNPAVSGTLASDGLGVSGQIVRSLRVAARLDNQVIAVDRFDLTQAAGVLTATGRYALNDGRFAFDASGHDLVLIPFTRRAQGTDADASQGSSDVAVPVSARFDVQASGEGTLAEPTGRGSVQTRQLAWDAYELGAVRLDVTAQAGHARVTVQAPALVATGDAEVSLSAPHQYSAHASVDGLPLRRVLAATGPAGPSEVFDTTGGMPPDAVPQQATLLDELSGALSATLSSRGELDAPENSVADVELRLTDVSAGAQAITFARPARLRFADRRLIVDDFDVQVGSTTLSVTGDFGSEPGDDRELRATVKGDITDLAPFARFVPSVGPLEGTGSIEAVVRAVGNITAPDITGEFRLTSPALTREGFPPLQDIALNATFARGMLDIQEARATWEGAHASASGQMPVTLLGDSLPAAYVNTLPALPARGRATARIESLTEKTVAPLLDPDALTDVAGRFDLTATIEASALDIAGVTGDVVFERAELELTRVPLAQTRPTRFRLADGRLNVVSWSWAGAGNRFDVSGGAQLSGNRPTLDLAAAGTLDLRMLGAFSRDIVTAGLASLDVAVTGSPDAPVVNGELSFRDASLVMRDPRVAITALQGTVDLSGERITLREVTASVNGGTLRIAGAADVSGFDLTGGALVATARGLALDVPQGLRTELDGDLRLDLSPASPSLSGRVTILQGFYRDPVSLAGILLSGVEATAAPQTASEAPGFLDRLSLDVDIVSAQNLVVDNNYGRLDLGSNLKVVGTLVQPSLAGRLTVQEGGEVFLGGRTYRVQRGTVDFTNATSIEPDLDLALETRVQRYDITLEVRGTPATIEATLRSPGASQADIVSLLLTGQPATDATLAQTEVARGQLLMLLSGEVLAFAGRSVGLDSVQVSRGLGGAASDFDLLATDTDPGARLTIGKNLRSNVEVVYSQSLSESGNITWVALYRPLRTVELRGSTLDDGSRAYEFRHELQFGGASRRAVGPARLQPREEARIGAVRLAGDPGFTERELAPHIHLSPGDRFDFYQWQQDRERLEQFYVEHGYLEARISSRREDMTPDTGEARIALVYDIERGPRAELLVEGYTMPAGLIADMKRTWSHSVYDGFLLDDLTAMARAQLVADGYVQGAASGDVLPQPLGGLKQVVLHITPGPRFAQKLIRFEGNQRQSDDALRDIVSAQGLEVQAWVTPDALTSAVEQHYHSRGFLAAKVTVAPALFEGQTAVLPVHVTEGAEFVVASIQVAGAVAKPEATLRKNFGIEPGSRYVPAALEPARRAVETSYLQDGYNSARVTVATVVDRERAQVAITLSVDEGRQQVLAAVDVEGGGRTSPGVIDRALKLEPGQPANRTDTYRAQKRLYDTGVFRTADVALEPVPGSEGAAPQPVRAVVTLEPFPTYRFRYGFRVNDRVGPAETGRALQPALVVDLLRRNLFGRALSAGVAGQLEGDRRLGRGVLSVPSLFGLPVTTSLFLTESRERFAPESATPFVDDSRDVTAEQRFRPTPRTAVTYGYSFVRSHIFEPDPIPGIPALDLRSTVARMTGTTAWDRRDDPSDARSGWFQSNGLEFGARALGSDLRYIRYLSQQYYFKTIGRDLVLASAFRLGLARGFDQDLIPSEKFYAGGGTSVRGFAEDGLGELDFFGEPRGGNALILLNQELRFPLFKWFRGVGFFDAGRVFPRASDLSFRSMDAGTGVGIRIHSPFALIRIDYGTALTRRDREPPGRWYFAIGHTF